MPKENWAGIWAHVYGPALIAVSIALIASDVPYFGLGPVFKAFGVLFLAVGVYATVKPLLKKK